MGWTYLASVSEATRAQVGDWLLPMACLNLRQWKLETAYDPAHAEVLSGHGAPPTAVIHEALIAVLRTLIVPGFRTLGMKTLPLEAWLEAGASTDRVPVALAHAFD